MNVSGVADETTADIFRERNTKAVRRIPKDLWRGVQRKLRCWTSQRWWTT